MGLQEYPSEAALSEVRQSFVLKYAIAGEDFAKGAAFEKFAAGLILFADFFRSATEDFAFDFSGNSNDTIKIGKDEIVRVDQDFTAADGHIVTHDAGAAFAIDGPNARAENGKIKRDDFSAIAHEAIADASGGAVSFRDGAH
jgi:hypothetical protein